MGAALENLLDLRRINLRLAAIVLPDIHRDDRAQRGGELVEIVVRALAIFRAVIHLGGVTEVSINAVLRRTLNPVAPAQILGLGIEAETVALEEFGVILLGDIRRKRAGLHRGEQ